ncbi:MAG: FAD-dependent thymidylate synthase [candidate division Zixibacteria bacterium]|nr:FAD-dependent thymidylate synthase [candidate division Zixibacteria bacterium]
MNGEENELEKVIEEKHQSVLEHASATFRIKGGSRVMKLESPIVFWDYEIDKENMCTIIKDE